MEVSLNGILSDVPEVDKGSGSGERILAIPRSMKQSATRKRQHQEKSDSRRMVWQGVWLWRRLAVIMLLNLAFSTEDVSCTSREESITNIAVIHENSDGKIYEGNLHSIKEMEKEVLTKLGKFVQDTLRNYKEKGFPLCKHYVEERAEGCMWHERHEITDQLHALLLVDCHTVENTRGSSEGDHQSMLVEEGQSTTENSAKQGSVVKLTIKKKPENSQVAWLRIGITENWKKDLSVDVSTKKEVLELLSDMFRNLTSNHNHPNVWDTIAKGTEEISEEPSGVSAEYLTQGAAEYEPEQMVSVGLYISEPSIIFLDSEVLGIRKQYDCDLLFGDELRTDTEGMMAVMKKMVKRAMLGKLEKKDDDDHQDLSLPEAEWRECEEIVEKQIKACVKVEYKDSSNAHAALTGPLLRLVYLEAIQMVDCFTEVNSCASELADVEPALYGLSVTSYKIKASIGTKGIISLAFDLNNMIM